MNILAKSEWLNRSHSAQATDTIVPGMDMLGDSPTPDNVHWSHTYLVMMTNVSAGSLVCPV